MIEEVNARCFVKTMRPKNKFLLQNQPTLPIFGERWWIRGRRGNKVLLEIYYSVGCDFNS